MFDAIIRIFCRLAKLDYYALFDMSRDSVGHVLANIPKEYASNNSTATKSDAHQPDVS